MLCRSLVNEGLSLVSVIEYLWPKLVLEMATYTCGTLVAAGKTLSGRWKSVKMFHGSSQFNIIWKFFSPNHAYCVAEIG